MPLALTARVHGERVAKALQLGLEYDRSHHSTPGHPRRPTRRTALRLALGDYKGTAVEVARHAVSQVTRFAHVVCGPRLN